MEDQVKENKVEEKQVEKKQIPVNPLFVSEDDVFDIEIKYYMDGSVLMVEGVDEKYDANRKGQELITVTFKSPSQGDCGLINSQIGGLVSPDGEMNITLFYRAEFIRMTTLIRKWSLSEKLSNESIEKLNPKIYKAICNKLREKISIEGIV